MNYVRVVVATALALAAVAVNLEAATAKWDRNPESTVTGYRLSYGTQSGVHPTTINVGNVLRYQFFPPAGLRYYVVVQAYDSSGALSAKSAEVILDLGGGGSTNQPPALTQPANQSTVRNTAASLALVANDPQGTPVSYSASGLPPGLTVNTSTGLISGTAKAVRTYTVTVRASDGALTSTKTFTWSVTAGKSTATTASLLPMDTTLNTQGATNKVNKAGSTSNTMASTMSVSSPSAGTSARAQSADAPARAQPADQRAPRPLSFGSSRGLGVG